MNYFVCTKVTVNVEEWINDKKLAHKLISSHFNEQKPNIQRFLDTGQWQQVLDLVKVKTTFAHVLWFITYVIGYFLARLT